MMPAKRSPRPLQTSIGLLAATLILVSSRAAGAQAPATYFQQNCFSCHTIGGGRLLGPDLKNVQQRQSREWLVDWLLDPDGVLSSGDPYALKMQQEARGVAMPRTPGMTRELANALLDFIEVESRLEKSAFAGLQTSDRELTPADIGNGRALFTGAVSLKNGGPACIGCHQVNSLGALGGGRLGLNLTRAYATLGGRKGLAAWLAAPPSLTMNPIFTRQPLDEEEILPLIAFLQRETEADLQENSASLINFVLIGVVGALVLLIAFDRLWNRRFRAVRRPLVDAASQPR